MYDISRLLQSNQLYNAGWTEDLRRIINHLHQIYPKAPLLAIGTSIGANILVKYHVKTLAGSIFCSFNLKLAAQVKYLGEEGDNTPLGAGAAICCPWDLLVRV